MVPIVALPQLGVCLPTLLQMVAPIFPAHSLHLTGLGHPLTDGANLPRRCPTMSLPFGWRTQNTTAAWLARVPVAQSVSKNTQQPSNAHYVQNALLVLTICGHISALIPTSVRLYVPSVEKLLLDSMTANDTKDCIRGRRSLSAKETSRAAVNGVAVGGLPVRMRSADISAQKLGGYASNHFSTRK